MTVRVVISLPLKSCIYECTDQIRACVSGIISYIVSYIFPIRTFLYINTGQLRACVRGIFSKNVIMDIYGNKKQVHTILANMPYIHTMNGYLEGSLLGMQYIHNSGLP
jgi:hypothetical protein